MELNKARDNRRGFCKDIDDKRKMKETLGPLLNKSRYLVTQNIEDAEVLNE